VSDVALVVVLRVKRLIICCLARSERAKGGEWEAFPLTCPILTNKTQAEEMARKEVCRLVSIKRVIGSFLTFFLLSSSEGRTGSTRGTVHCPLAGSYEMNTNEETSINSEWRRNPGRYVVHLPFSGSSQHFAFHARPNCP